MRRSFGSALVIGLALVAVSLPDGALAGPPPEHAHLSSRLDQLADAPLTTASNSQQADALSLPGSGPGSLMRTKAGFVVTVRFRSDPRAHLAELRDAGADILHVSDDYSEVTAVVAGEDLVSVGAVNGVQAVVEVLQPMLAGSAARRQVIAQAARAGCTGAKTSEGDAQLKADAARSTYNVDGSGVKLGVLSDSYNRLSGGLTTAPADVASGDLPGTGNPCGRTTPVQVLDDPAVAGRTDEGRAMLQIVHDLAPGAALAFATGSTGETAFADNIRALANAASTVIVDDIIYFDEPFYQDGPVAVAVNEVAAAGVSYFSATGNSNSQDSLGRDIGSFESPAFRPGPTCVGRGENACEDFDPSAGVDTNINVIIPPQSTMNVTLQWAEPWNGVTTDLDLYLTNGGAGIVKLSENDNIAVTQKPFEYIAYTNTTASAQSGFLVVSRFNQSAAQPTPRFKLIFSPVSDSEYPVSNGGDIVGPTVFGHSPADGSSAVAAVRYDDASQPEYFSSRGPVTKYFGPVNGTTAAAALGTPVVRSVPDISATDGVQNTFFGQGSPPRFFGTSAAAPHAAAVGALELQRSPTASPAQVRAAQAAGATPIPGYGPLAVGAGLLNAQNALGQLTPTAVRWRGGRAKATAHGVRVHWRTARQAGLLGFDVLRGRRGSRRVRLTKQMIPGDELRTHASTGDYSLVDRSGRAGDRYFVVAHSVDWGRTVHGPLVARP